MALFLEITNGNLQGARFMLSAGLRIGRRHGQIIIDDPKISSRHAHVEASFEGTFTLHDDGSSNGIRHRGSRVKELELKDGTDFQLGDTRFRVIAGHTESLDLSVSEIRLPESWKSILITYLNNQRLQLETRAVPVTVFRSPVKLEFLQGIQYPTTWLMSYGPRQVGSKSLDFQILELGAPDLCFELIPSNKGVLYRTKSSEVVLLNDKPVEQQFLSGGEIISIHQTRILVHLNKTD